MGTYEEPFSAHRYRYIQRELSQVTLAQGGLLTDAHLASLTSAEQLGDWVQRQKYGVDNTASGSQSAT